MALTFASMGVGDVTWPTAATLARFVFAAGGGVLALDVLGWGAAGIYGCVAGGILIYSLLLALSITRLAWRR
jgi:hypothetical protein